MFEIISNINLGLLTFFVPWAIFLFSDLKEQSPLDKNILFDKVIEVKKFIIYTFVIFVPLILLKIPNFKNIFIGSDHISYSTNIIIFLISSAIWVVSLVFFIRMLSRSYSWVREDRYKFRTSYLKELSDEKHIVNSWRSIWVDEIDKKDPRNEIDFLNIFFEKIDSLKDSDSIKSIVDLLEIFDSFLEKRNISIFLVIKTVFFKKALYLHYWSYENEKSTFEEESQDNVQKILQFQNIKQLSESIYKKITAMSFQSNLGYSYFKINKEYINDLINSDKKDYAICLVGIFFKEFTNIIDKNDNTYHFWDYFPEEWKITNESIKNPVPIKIYNTYMKFVSDKLGSCSENRADYFAIDSIALHIFPKFDPVTLSWIITLLNLYNTNPIESLIKNGKKFGSVSRPYVSEGSFNEEKFSRAQESLKISTINFIMNIYNQYFTPEKINSLISDLDKVDATANNEIFNKESLSEIFSKIKLSIQE